ncbi:hypothetical protein EYW98_18410 [Escherichia coli]|uniref:hypothetical protein n=1 Tax=Escherichia sp. MOD1-EC7003 TaxID=2093900 RepID=UPI000CF759CA|nr:hypothetical protein [Escherichia sp. MOD1-EC7003]EGO8361346.1 hypothetical protein [Escherichia coli]EGO8378958.1 hypothetical protein [Escherichia coli]MCH0696093.1 hypothetical protein [Escherichia coli]
MKKVKSIFFIVCFFVLCIEIGMRLIIWRSVNLFTSNVNEYTLNVTVYDKIGFGSVGCIGYDEANYLTIPYSIWLVKDVFLAKFICQYRSEHINIRIIGSENDVNYHWSFKQWQFIDTAKEIQEKNHE